MTDPGDPATDDRVEAEPAAAAMVFGDGLGLARRYVAALASAGVQRGLIGPREAGRIWSRHLLNCAVPSPLLAQGTRIVDIGSGAGLPGIPLAICRPDCRVDLVEPMARRATFLSEVVADLGLTNCRVIRGRAQQVADRCGQADAATARAVASLADLARWAAPLLGPGGLLLALKGASAADELARDRAAMHAAGFADLEVLQVGAGMVDPPTTIVRARRAVSSPGRSVRRG